MAPTPKSKMEENSKTEEYSCLMWEVLVQAAADARKQPRRTPGVRTRLPDALRRECVSVLRAHKPEELSTLFNIDPKDKSKVEEWTTKNLHPILTPDTVTAGSHFLALWQCEAPYHGSPGCGAMWTARIDERVNRRRSCPKCSRSRRQSSAGQKRQESNVNQQKSAAAASNKV